MIWCFDGMKRKAVVPPPHPVTALHHASSVSRHRFKALTYSALVFSAAVPSLQDERGYSILAAFASSCVGAAVPGLQGGISASDTLGQALTCTQVMSSSDLAAVVSQLTILMYCSEAAGSLLPSVTQ